MFSSILNSQFLILNSNPSSMQPGRPHHKAGPKPLWCTRPAGVGWVGARIRNPQPITMQARSRHHKVSDILWCTRPACMGWVDGNSKLRIQN